METVKDADNGVVVDRSYRTYEEWKPALSSSASEASLTFLPYL